MDELVTSRLMEPGPHWSYPAGTHAELRCLGQVESTDSTLNFMNMNFQLPEASVNGVPWESALRFVEAKQSFEDVFLRLQELSVHTCKKSGKEGKAQHA